MTRFLKRGLLLLVMVATICVLSAPARPLAQDATPAASPVALPNPLAQLVAAIAAGDAAAIAALFTTDGTYEDVPNAVTAHGRWETASWSWSTTSPPPTPRAANAGNGGAR